MQRARLETQKHSTGLQTFLEHFGFPLLFLGMILAMPHFDWWSPAVAAAGFALVFVLLAVGAGLCIYARWADFRNAGFLWARIEEESKTHPLLNKWGRRLIFASFVLCLVFH